MTRLSVNLNKVALLRNARDLDLPSVTRAAAICIQAGAHGITVHPRPDRRHIRPSDVEALAAMLTVEFNIEGNPFAGPEAGYPGFMQIVRDARPAQATLVPDGPGQSTSDHGWDLARDGDRLRPLIAELKALGIRVSLFMDAEAGAISRAADCGADRIELYTEPYARAFARGEPAPQIARFRAAAQAATAAGLQLNAGHDLNLDNLGPFLREVPGVEEVSIGHALIAEALEMGLAQTVRSYVRILADAAG